MIRVEVDEVLCSGEGTCVEFCPFSIFALCHADGKVVARPVHSEACTACYTCVGQCPTGAIALYFVEEGNRHG